MSSRNRHAVRVADHPRALRQIRRAKGLGGLGAFALVALLSLRAGVPPFDAGVRALAFGVGGYVVAWALAVHAWRHLAVAELRAARVRALERSRAASGADGS